jgi:hypothetical protein
MPILTNGETCTGLTHYGSISILSTVDGVLYSQFGLDGKYNENDEVLLQIPFKVFMTGDLAFTHSAMALVSLVYVDPCQLARHWVSTW